MNKPRNKLKVMCIDLPWVSTSAFITELNHSFKSKKISKNIQDNIEVVTCNIKDFPSQKEFKSAISDIDVILTEQYIFDRNQTAPVLFESNLNLKFLQLNSAGCELVIREVTKRKQFPCYPVARLAGKFGTHMAEYVISQLISFERHFPEIFLSQKTLGDNWNARSLTYRRLKDLTISILGLGNIGQEVAKRCKSFGMTVWGMTRNPVPLEKRSSNVDQYRLVDDLEEVLSVSDYVCSILPSTPQTIGLLDKDGFKSCANKKSVFINVGRGSVVSEAVLIEAIKNKRLGGAILDVFVNEPLPSSSELWKLDNVIITPHVGAVTMIDELADVVADQLERYLTGNPLLHVVDYENGY